jgi:hypothetical protein
MYSDTNINQSQQLCDWFINVIEAAGAEYTGSGLRLPCGFDLSIRLPNGRQVYLEAHVSESEGAAR